MSMFAGVPFALAGIVVFFWWLNATWDFYMGLDFATASGLMKLGALWGGTLLALFAYVGVVTLIL